MGVAHSDHYSKFTLLFVETEFFYLATILFNKNIWVGYVFELKF